MAGEHGHRLFAALYARAEPRMERGWLGDRRAALMALVEGDVVLEIGAGTGANLPHVPARPSEIVLTEPDPAMRGYLARAVAREWRAGVRIEADPAERIPMPDGSVDTLIGTLTLCSVDDQDAALAEMRRILRPGGRFVFLEHVRGEGTRGRAQDAVTPLWRRAGAGCRPNRDTVGAIRRAGFAIRALETGDEGLGIRLVTPFAFGWAESPAGA